MEMFGSVFFIEFPKYKNMTEMKIAEEDLGGFETNALKSFRLLAKERGVNLLSTAYTVSLAPFQARPLEYRFTNVTCAYVSILV